MVPVKETRWEAEVLVKQEAMLLAHTKKLSCIVKRYLEFWGSGEVPLR